MKNTASEVVLQKITQFELSNLIRKSKLFSKIKLAPATRLVLESLVYHFPNIRVSIKTLEEETGNSRRSVDNALNELKEKGLIITIQTGRSSIFKLTQTFFNHLEVAYPTCKNETNRHAEVACPINKHEKKENNKTFQDKNFNNDITGAAKFIKNQLEKESYLTNKAQAEIILNSFHQHNVKSDNDVRTILTIKQFWNFKSQSFPVLDYFEQRKQQDQLFNQKIKHFISDIDNSLNQVEQKRSEILTAWIDYKPELCS